VRDEAGVREKFGVGPESIPDYLALVGDSADGFPGISGWGPKSAATVLARHRHLEAIPQDPARWDVALRNSATLSVSLRERWSDALLFRDLATLRTDAPVFKTISDLEWKAPAVDFDRVCEKLRAPDTARLASELAQSRAR